MPVLMKGPLSAVVMSGKACADSSSLNMRLWSDGANLTALGQSARNQNATGSHDIGLGPVGVTN